MNKPFLLIAGDNYYPSRGTGDWQQRFDSYEEANAAITESPVYIKITKGKRKGETELSYTYYEYKENKFDWYEIVNLEREFIESQWFEFYNKGIVMYYFKNSRMSHQFMGLADCIKHGFWNTCYLDEQTRIYEEDPEGEQLIGFIAHDGIKLRYYELSDRYDVEDFKNIEKRTVRYVELPGLGETYEN